MDVESNDLETLLGHPQASAAEAIKEVFGVKTTEESSLGSFSYNLEDLI